MATAAAGAGRRDDDDSAEARALERLQERSSSRLGVDGAMRARDVSRPSAADLAAASAAPARPRTRRTGRD